MGAGVESIQPSGPAAQERTAPTDGTPRACSQARGLAPPPKEIFPEGLATWVPATFWGDGLDPDYTVVTEWDKSVLLPRTGQRDAFYYNTWKLYVST